MASQVGFLCRVEALTNRTGVDRPAAIAHWRRSPGGLARLAAALAQVVAGQKYDWATNILAACPVAIDAQFAAGETFTPLAYVLHLPDGPTAGLRDAHWLLERGAYPDAAGGQALTQAVRTENWPGLSLLLRYGADPSQLPLEDRLQFLRADWWAVARLAPRPRTIFVDLMALTERPALVLPGVALTPLLPTDLVRYVLRAI